MTQFYDSTNPELIPDRDYAALYYDGIYGQAGKDAAPLFPHKRWITIGWDYRHCGIVDFEPGNPVYSSATGLWEFVRGRLLDGHPSRVYCDRSDAAKALSLTQGMHTLWWIATGDGKDWTPDELSKELHDNWNADIPADVIWGNQNLWVPRKYDRSNLFLDW